MFGRAAMHRSDAAAAAQHWLDFIGLRARQDVLPGELNLHQSKFLELARALAAQPRLLLLDEVLSGLAPGEIDEAVALIGRIRQRGTAIVLVEHVLPAVIALADRVVVLDQGRVLAEGRTAEVMARVDVAKAYLGVGGA
jgi:branched-chain amino acid transport system permease protein